MKNRTIYKFPVPLGVITVINAPALGRVVHAGIDPASGDPAIWMELDPAALTMLRHFLVFATGDHIEGDGGFPYDLHVGSVITGPLVWHIYERRL